MAEASRPGWGLALLRVVLGIIFLVHGSSALFFEPGVAGVAAMLAAQGVPAANAGAWVVVAAEFLGGLALLVGWLTRWVAGVLFLGTLVALFVAYAENGFFVFRPAGEWGYEYHLLLLAGLGCLVLGGAGVLAMDDWRSARR
ncbi:MAG TPA: DoxX family protein [Longimicrobiales bacterium]